MSRTISTAGLIVALAGTALVSGQAPAGQPPAAQPPAAGQPQGPTFKVQVDYVEVDVLVTDARGNYVRDLKKEDFQVFEDGKPQAVTDFALVDIPIERAERPLFAKQAIEPDVRSNERPFDGRIYVMLLDEAHTLPSNTNLVRRAAQKFIDEKLGANDLMAVVFARGVVGGGGSYGQEFTNNKRLLSLAVQQFTGSAPRSATLNKLQDYVNTSSRALGRRGRTAAGHGPAGARVQRARDARGNDGRRRLVRERPRPQEDHSAVQRGHQLRHPRPVRQRGQQRRVDDHVAHAGLRQGRDQGQRQPVRDRPARPDGAVGRQHRARQRRRRAIPTRPV